MIMDQFMFGVISAMGAKVGQDVLTGNVLVTSYQLVLEEQVVPNFAE